MIIIVFGLAAAGKTYVGQVLNKYFDFHHEDADQWLPKQMQDYIEKGEIFTVDMLDAYTQIIINNIEILSKKYPKLVISQALYRQKNREQIQQYFSSKKIMFIQVEAEDEVIQQRLIDRGDWVDADYASKMHEYFEPPHDQVQIIKNNEEGDVGIITQLQNIIQDNS